MPTIRFSKGFPEIVVDSGTNLMHALRINGRPVASSCGGQGVCTKCVVTIIKGRENLSKQNDTEEHLREVHDIPKEGRVSCQTKVLGDIVADTDYW